MQQIAKDFYSVLDISPSTSKEEIRQAYLRLARRYHPDVNSDPRSRERFEEINQAYTILSDDEARIFYNLYREGAAEDEADGGEDYISYQVPSQSWWQQNSSTLGVGLAVSCVLAAYGIVLYLPNIQSTQIFSSGVESRGIKRMAPMISKQDVKASNSNSSKPEKFENNPKLTTQRPETSSEFEKKPATVEQPEPKKRSGAKPAEANSDALEPVKPKVIDQVVPPKIFETVAPLPTLSLKTAAPSSAPAEVLTTIDTPARAYELLAYYALVVGDLNQFKKALSSAHRENASFSQINSLMLFLQKLETRHTSLENTLQSLRRRVIRENATRLTPLQLESLKTQTENWQSSENS